VLIVPRMYAAYESGGQRFESVRARHFPPLPLLKLLLPGAG
jgi:hypothetical protein